MRPSDTAIHDRLRDILRDHGLLPAAAPLPKPDTDLYSAGLTSLASVDLMLAIEHDFGFLFPDHALSRRSFASIAAMTEIILRHAPAERL